MPQPTAAEHPSAGPGRLIAAGIAATLAGIGVGRFAYAALLPGLINAGWLSTSDAGYVGAANLLGYLVGALLAGRAERWLGARLLINASTVLIALGFFLSTWAAPVWWFSLWRFVAGVTGAFLIVVVPSLVATRLPPHLRKHGATWIFTGIGIGVVLSATLVPALVHRGLPLAWLALGLISLVPVALAWVRWPPVPVSHSDAPCQPAPRLRPGAVAGVSGLRPGCHRLRAAHRILGGLPGAPSASE